VTYEKPAPYIGEGVVTQEAQEASRDIAPSEVQVRDFPPGLVGDVASFILSVSPRPVPQIALAASVGLLSGIMGRAYNISGSGLNQYVLMLARTGVGKDAISVGTSKLMKAVRQTVPAAADFIGPGELVSSAGLIKWMAEKPCIVSILGEFGVKMKEMASPNANAHLSGIERVLLQMYSKSGRDNTFEAIAYSDKANNTKQLHSPSLTILAESVPERFYEMLDERMVMSGLLPRFMIYEYMGDREYIREGSELVQPSSSLVQRMCDLTAQCLALGQNGNVHNVPMTDDALNIFRHFDRWTTDEMNKDKSEVTSGLWNRAHLKAMKLAAVIAVGRNYLNPLISVDEAHYATHEIVVQTRRTLNKFELGDVGVEGGNELKQLNCVIKCIGEYMSWPYARISNYGPSEKMHGSGVFSESYLSRRLLKVAAFSGDKAGPTRALKRAIDNLLNGDEIRELSKSQLAEQFDTKARSFCVSNPERFIQSLKKIGLVI